MNDNEKSSVPLIVATILRGDGITGVDTHIRQVRRHLIGSGVPNSLVTPFSWARPLTYPVFGFRLLLERFSRPASVAWYLRGHEAFVRNALRKRLAGTGDCVVYAQDPFTARAALRTRRGPHQRVVMGVHLRTSMAEEWADKEHIKRGGPVYRSIQDVEREVFPAVDRLVFVSRWGRDALMKWLPAVGAVPYAVIGNFVSPWPATLAPNTGETRADLVTVGNLDLVKNHRFLLDVLAEARQAGTRLTLDIFGDGACRKDLEQKVRALGLEDQVRFQGFRPDVRYFLPQYRVYVHASYSESLPLAIIEAMSAGLPIVTSDAGGIGELCDDGVEARFWPLDDPARAAAMLADLLGNEPERLKAAQAASERFARDFDADVVGPRLRSFLLDGTVSSSAE